MSTIADTPRAPARQTTRPTVDFDTYVLQFSRAMRGNALLCFAGMACAVGAAVNLDGTALVVFGAVGLGMVGGGLAGAGAGAAAHAAYTQHLAHVEVVDYPEPRQVDEVRAFVPTSDGVATVRAGRFSLPRSTWSALFATARRNGGRLTRDGASKVLPRVYYRDWQGTLSDLQRLGLVDGDGRVTAEGWAFCARDVDGTPYPNGGNVTAGASSTHARRAGAAHGDDL